MAPPETKPPRREPRIKAAPKPRQVYWCDLPQDAQLPEFWKRRPVLVLSKGARLYGHVTVLPLSSKAQPDNPNAVACKSVIPSEETSWIICDHILTLAVSRLSLTGRNIRKIPEEDFRKVMEKVHKILPTPRVSEN